MSPKGNEEDAKYHGRKKPIHLFSPLCFHLNRVKNGKDDSSSEAHLQSSKSRGSYLDPELSIFAKIF
jgi:hypothetical protein